jgi:hypothetical protein
MSIRAGMTSTPDPIDDDELLEQQIRQSWQAGRTAVGIALLVVGVVLAIVAVAVRIRTMYDPTPNATNAVRILGLTSGIAFGLGLKRLLL